MTTSRDGLLLNSAGRYVPDMVDGRTQDAFGGIGAPRPMNRKMGPVAKSCRDFPKNGDKRSASLIEALERAGLRSGMTLTTHHHLRNGDFVALELFTAASRLGVRDLIWVPSATFPCHQELIPFLESGVLKGIQGSLNGPLGAFASQGKMRDTAILRSHGGRYRAIQEGDIRIDIAVIAAPASDAFGNCNGTEGPSACGPLGFALADAQYAEHVIVVTDHLVPFPCIPWAIQGNYVDQVVVVDKIGDANKIVSGTTQLTRSPDRLLIAEMAAQFLDCAGIVKDGFSFQAGAGGTSLAFVKYMGEIMASKGVKARFMRGGSTGLMVGLLESGLSDYLLDGQSFDLEGVRSLATNPRHVATSPFVSYNYHGKGNIASILDVSVLGATEIDLDFNANVATHSDGQLLHGLGGFPDALFAGCTVLTAPLVRNRMPIIRDRVTTLCGPGELVDVVITDRGIAVNPIRQDLLDRVRGSGLPLKSIAELKSEAEKICGGPPEDPPLTDEIIGVIEWVDGTILDAVYRTDTVAGSPAEGEF